jgi:hypothetical protein
MKDNYAGIDYGHGMTNVDHETGIRYGVISQNEVLQAWADESEPNYLYFCPKCDAELGNEYPDQDGCPNCGHEFEGDDFEFMEPLSFSVDDGKYIAECGDDGDIFITKSPYFTFAQFCSPCAPGAVYLMNPYKSEGYAKEQLATVSEIAPLAYGEAFRSHAEYAGFARGYCFGHDWFESGKAPYPVFSVETGELVLPKEK